MENTQKTPDKESLAEADFLCGAVETIIFMSDKPVSLKRMGKILENKVSSQNIKEAIERLQKEYEQKHHGIALYKVAEGYQLRTKTDYAKYIPDILRVRSLMLTSTALEVLAIIAYRQPISKMEIEKIRGVDSSYIVRGLMEKNLVKVTGKSDGLGRPTLYGTTQEFLETFNLAKLEDLPPEYELEEMIAQGSPEPSPIAGLANNRKDGGQESFDDLEEMDLMEKTIKSIPSGTSFTRELTLKNKQGKNIDKAVQSAFDILEEHMDRQSVCEANIKASQSEYTPLFNEYFPINKKDDTKKFLVVSVNDL